MGTQSTPLQPATLLELLRLRADEVPERRAYTFLLDGESEVVHMTYGELDRKARAIAAALQQSRVPQTTDNSFPPRVLLLYPPGLDFIAAFFGCLYAGVVAVLAYPPDPSRLSRTLPRLQAIVKDAKTKIALTTQSLFAMADFIFEEATDLKALKWMTTDNVDLGISDVWTNPAIARDSLAFIQYTSGSTGHPKGVMISHGNCLHNLLLIHLASKTCSESRLVSWLPQYHDMGLVTGILSPLYIGFPATLMSPIDFLRRPLLWLKAISRMRTTHSGGPNFAYEHCIRKVTQEQKESLDLSSWEVAYNGAEPVRHETLERFSEAFESRGFRREAFLPCYGLAETTVGVCWSNKTTQPITCSVQSSELEQNRVVLTSADGNRELTLVGCGKIPQDQQILIVNPDTLTRCAADQVGEIWVSGPSVAQGYWNRLEETKETFQAHLNGKDELSVDSSQSSVNASGTFLRTGDLGFLQDGELFVTGRLKDVIIISGVNHYPQDIEKTVEQSHPSMRPGCGAAFSIEVDRVEKLVIVQEVERRYHERRQQNKGPTAAAERRHLSDRRHVPVQAGFDPIDPVPLDIQTVIGNIRQAVVERHDLEVYEILLLKPGTIPKTSSGKIQRHACKAGYLSRSLEVI